MNTKIQLYDAWRSLKNQGARSFINALSIGFAVASMLVMTQLELHATRQIQSTKDRIGPNALVAWVSQSAQSMTPINQYTVEKLRTANHPLKIFPFQTQSRVTQHQAHSERFTWVGAEPRMLQALGIKNSVSPMDSGQAQVGAHVCQSLALPSGGLVAAQSQNTLYKVECLTPVANHPLLDFDPNRSVFVDIDKSANTNIEQFLIIAPDAMSVADAKALFERLVQAHYQPSHIYFRDADLLVSHIRHSIESFQSAFYWIACLTTLMAMIGMFSQQWLNYLERRGECGMRLSLGATYGSILRLFLLEAVILALVSIFIGLALGGLILQVVLHKLGWPVLVGYVQAGLLGGFSLALVAALAILPTAMLYRQPPSRLLSFQS